MAKDNVSNNIQPTDANISKGGGGQIVLYQPDENISIEVKLDVNADTVWLNTSQMSVLFNREDSVIRRHIIKIFKEHEVAKDNNVHFLHVNGVKKPVPFYSLDVIISVGYRVKSSQGILFRQWASKILKQYLLQGYAIHSSLQQVEYHLGKQISEQGEKLQELQQKVQKHEEQLDFFIRTNTPPAEMVFYNGEFFTARVAIESLIKTAKQRVIIIDHYIDARTFDMFDVRSEGVQGIIYTQGVGSGMLRLKQEHDSQPNTQPVEIYKWRQESHDRWLIIDDKLYHCGHSLNATGRKLSAITLMGTSPEEILSKLI